MFFMEHSIVRKARERDFSDQHHNFRENAEKARHDDELWWRPKGCSLTCAVIFDAFDAIEKRIPREWSYWTLLDGLLTKPMLKISSGRRIDLYLAIMRADERIKALVTDEISLGDSDGWGNLLLWPWLMRQSRLIPEVIGKESVTKDDSFSSGLLEYPQYTALWMNDSSRCPHSGHHGK